MVAATRVLVVVSGLADPDAEWTPLSQAGTPHLDRMAREGRIGQLHGGAWSPWRAFLSVLGIDEGPELGPAAALGVGAPPAANEVVYRADWVTAAEDRILDPRAGDIDGVEAEALQAHLAERNSDVRLRRLSGPRNLAYFAAASVATEDDTAPHVGPPITSMGRPLGSELPEGVLRDLVDMSLLRLPPHDVNEVRLDLGENPATALWPHGGGELPPSGSRGWLPPSTLLIGPGEEYAGLASWAGIEYRECEPGDTAAVATALEALDDGVFLVLHATSVLAATASGATDAKRDAISYLDARVIGPLLGALEERDEFALAVVSGGRIDGSTHRWTREDVPFVFLSSALDVSSDSANSDRGFSETACAGSGLHLHAGAELGELLLG